MSKPVLLTAPQRRVILKALTIVEMDDGYWDMMSLAEREVHENARNAIRRSSE